LRAFEPPIAVSVRKPPQTATKSLGITVFVGAFAATALKHIQFILAPMPQSGHALRERMTDASRLFLAIPPTKV
jgi:hypothetical protein